QFAGSIQRQAVHFPYKPQPSTFRDKWPALQVIGKDILIPAHGIYWLIMLHAIGFPDDQMPQLLVHGWWNLGGAKMSKSAGNIIDPFVLVDKYGADALRYYLMSDIATGKDADFSEERLGSVYESDLANGLGNPVNRVLNMTHRYRKGVLRKIDIERFIDDVVFAELKPWESTEVTAALSLYGTAFAQFRPDTALNAAFARIIAYNYFVDQSAPWKRAKDHTFKDALDAILYNL